ncbi:MAG TPA: NAD-dependent epimerase/dehydratase family protein [Thermoleophilaceae bacterium]
MARRHRSGPGTAPLGDAAARDALASRRAAITGGAGFLGSHLADLLVDAGAEVLVVDNFVRGRPENLAGAMERGSVTLLEADIRERRAVECALEHADVVFHLAALRIPACAADPAEAISTMADGTLNVIEAALAQGVGKVVFASSASVYGAAEQFPTPETQHPYCDTSLYGALKSLGEGMLRSFHASHGLRYVALRYFNLFGPRLDRAGRYAEVLPRWIELVERGEAPLVIGDGGQTMDWVYVEDAARANLLAAAARVDAGVFNVGSGVETSLGDLAHLLVDVAGGRAAPRFARDQAPLNPVPRRLANVSRAREALGFETRVDLEEGLRRTIEWWREGAEHRAAGALA